MENLVLLSNKYGMEFEISITNLPQINTFSLITYFNIIHFSLNGLCDAWAVPPSKSLVVGLVVLG